MMKGKRALLCSVMLSLCLAQGCSPFVENNEIEEISPVTFWFIKEGKNKKLSMSTLVPPIGLEKKRVFNIEVNMIKQAGKDFNLNYYNELQNGQLRMLIIEEKLARKGILPIINTLLNDPKTPQRLYVMVVKGDFEKYMLNELKQSEKFDFYLYQTLKHFEKASQGEMTIVNLHQFKNLLYTHFSDPYTPVFKTDEDDFIYEGTALFKDDKLQNIIGGVDDQMFQLINNNKYLKLLALPEISLVIGKARSSVFFNLNKKNTALSLKVNVDGGIEEYTGDKNLQDEREFNALIHEAEAQLEKQTAELLKKMQDMKVDPFEIGGEALFPFTKPMSDNTWKKKWSKMDIDVDYRLNLRTVTNTE
ncbi:MULTISPECIES: Ger(x)C family spore germination protein [Bacillus]|uniref:Ger(x)C family spore germination protein n=1 Tax=Bacillus TaxID=1386 RepID=UPI00041DD42D|nr:MULTISPECIES: Ger(x)C family spore germination C-terminal domain-containing protein [Bacillus]QHZ46191.1 spore gernimation protein [Bacillus sp. NSP9.1]WFA06414.1 Ger(x)C family spore germination C-terminal domain-containing protein [Bacillus sp. HSf4]